MILTIRTDKPEAEIALYDNGKLLKNHSWQAHRHLAETIHEQIAKNLQFVSKNLSDIDGIVIYKGPGSYTGLRIGMSVANALAYSLQCNIVATSGKNWAEDGLNKLKDNLSDNVATPLYEAEAKTTKPRR